MNWPEVVELRDVTITPLLGGSSKARLVLAADPPSRALEHFRYDRTVSALQVLPLAEAGPDAATPTVVVEEPTIYGGLLFRHFGHALSESMHRLWPRFALRELHGANVAFSLVHNAKVMPYAVEALNLHGITRAKVLRIEETTLFRRLYVGIQARRMAGPTLIPDYRTMLDRELARRMPAPSRSRSLYVSRMHHHHTGSFYGESLVERALANEGFEIVYPERHSLTELVALLRCSGIAVFAEGSAIHALELCGTGTPDVFVIGRRGGATARFTPLLSDICRRWAVSDHLLATAGMADDPKKHSGVIDLVAVAADLRDFAHLPGLRFDAAAIDDAIAADLAAHLADPRASDSPDPGKARRLRDSVLAAASPALSKAAIAPR